MAAGDLSCVVTVLYRCAGVEINAESDFGGRNKQFQQFVSQTGRLAFERFGSLVRLCAAAYTASGRTVGEELTQLIATVGENMSLRRSQAFAVEKGVVSAYVHNQITEGLGKIGVLVALESAGDSEKLSAFGRQLAMHIAAASPLAVDRDGVDASVLDRERQVLADQARASGRPEEIIEKMVEGRLRKFYEEVCLLEQVFVIDGENKVQAALEAAGKDAGAPIKVAGFVRFQLGEGIDKGESDFAAEVAAATKS